MKERKYILFNQEMFIPENKILFYKILNTELYNSKIVKNKFQEKLNTYKNLDELIENIYYDSVMLIQERIQLTLSSLNRLHNLNLSIDYLYKSLDQKKDLVDLIEQMEGICDELIVECMDMVINQEEKRLYRELRKANRGRVIGIGCGIDGFVKAQINAGTLNMAIGGIHTIVNAISNIKTSATIIQKKENLKNGPIINKKYRDLFNRALDLCLEEHFKIYIKMKKFVDFSIYEIACTKDMLDQAQRSNTINELLFLFINKDLTSEFIAKKILTMFGDSNGSFSKLLLDIGLDDTRLKKEILYDFVQSMEVSIEDSTNKNEYINSQINKLNNFKHLWHIINENDFVNAVNLLRDNKIKILRKTHPTIMHLSDHISYLQQLEQLRIEYDEFESEKIKDEILKTNDAINLWIVIKDRTIKDGYKGVSVSTISSTKYQCKDVEEYYTINNQIKKIIQDIDKTKFDDYGRILCYKEIYKLYRKYGLLENFLKYINIFSNYEKYYNNLLQSKELELEDKYEKIIKERDDINTLYFQNDTLRTNVIKLTKQTLNAILTINGVKYENIKDAVKYERIIKSRFQEFKIGIKRIYPDYFDNNNFMNFNNLNSQNETCKSLFNILYDIGNHSTNEDIILQLAICYAYGFGTEPNLDKAKKLLLSVKRKTGFYEYHLSYVLKQDPKSWERKYKSEYLNEWLGHLVRSSDFIDSNAIAYATMGDCHYFEIGYKHHKKHIENALDCWKRASKYHNRYAMYRLSEYYWNNNIDIKSVHKQLLYIVKNHTPNDLVPIEKVCYMLYMIYKNNDKMEEAIECLKLASIYNSLEAQMELAKFYMKGLYVEKDFEKSYYWYSKASILGNKKAIKLKNKLEKKDLVFDSKLDQIIMNSDKSIIESLSENIELKANNHVDSNKKIYGHNQIREKKKPLILRFLNLIWKCIVTLFCISSFITSLWLILDFSILTGGLLLFSSIFLFELRGLFEHKKGSVLLGIIGIILFIIYCYLI